MVGYTRGVVVLQVPVAVAGSVHRHGVAPIAVPVTGDRDVARVTEEEVQVSHALGIGVAQIDVAGGLPVEARRVDSVTVPVPEERDVAGIPEGEELVGGSQPRAVLGEVVDDVKAVLAGSVD